MRFNRTIAHIYSRIRNDLIYCEHHHSHQVRRFLCVSVMYPLSQRAMVILFFFISNMRIYIYSSTCMYRYISKKLCLRFRWPFQWSQTNGCCTLDKTSRAAERMFVRRIGVVDVGKRTLWVSGLHTAKEDIPIAFESYFLAWQSARRVYRIDEDIWDRGDLTRFIIERVPKTSASRTWFNIKEDTSFLTMWLRV